MLEIGLGVVLFTAIVLGLVWVILLAKSKLVASGNVIIIINDENNERNKLSNDTITGRLMLM